MRSTLFQRENESHEKYVLNLHVKQFGILTRYKARYIALNNSDASGTSNVMFDELTTPKGLSLGRDKTRLSD